MTEPAIPPPPPPPRDPATFDDDRPSVGPVVVGPEPEEEI